MLKNVKIGTKLIGGFLMVAALTAAMGVFAIVKLRAISQQYSADWQKNSESLQALGMASSSYQRLRTNLRDYLNAVTTEDQRTALGRVNDRRQEFGKATDDFRALGLTDEQKESLSQVKAAWADYTNLTDEVVALKKNGRVADANAAVVRGADIATKMTQIMDQLVKQENMLSDSHQKETAASASSATWMVTAVILLVVLLATSIGVALTISITRPMREVTAAAQALAEGDASQNVQFTSGDEMGKLAESFRLMTSTIRERAEAAKKIAAGDMSVQVAPKSERDVLGQALKKCLEVLNELMRDMDRMANEHNAGDIDVTIEAQKFDGDYRKVAQGINDMVGGHVSMNKKAIVCVGEFGKGNFEAPLEKFPGKKAFINENIEQVRVNFKALIADFNLLSKAAVEGRLATRADATRHNGDFRKIVEGVNETLNSVVGPMNDFAAVLDGLAGGDLTLTVAKSYAGDFDSLKKSINTLAIQVRQAMQQIGQNTAALVASSEELNKVSQQMSSSADETAAQANVVSAASDQVSKNVQTVATGADEMGASIKEIAKNTADATKVAIAAVRTAETTNQTIEKLGQSSAEIGQVIKVITSIAQQTNLLALNATIEAARAGEAGKGFAVVANEVKELAKETAKATEDISQKIEAIQADTKGAVSAIAQISTVINQINDIQNTIASAVEEQSATTNEISRNLAEAAKGAVDITKNIGGVAEAARSTTAGAVDTQKSAQSLERMASELQELVSQFKYDEHKGSISAKPANPSRSKANGKYVAPVTEAAYTEAVH
jgi:methyl-accepting chemotaxis protein